MNHRPKLFILWAIQGLAAFIWLVSLPTNTENGILFGFSASRLVLMGVMLALTAISAGLYWWQRGSNFQIPERLYWAIYLPAVILSVSAPAGILILRELGKSSDYIYGAYAARLAPLAFWLALSAFELALLMASQKWEPSVEAKNETRLFFRHLLFALIALGIVGVFITTSKFGITPYNDGSWGEPTTPLLEWQIILALCSSLIFLNLEERWKWFQKDNLICLFIYIFTCLIWLSQPINPGFFATPPRAPNFEIYPFSDALIYAQYAQSALVGNGFIWPEVPTRPLYISFLTWLHAIAGQDYNHVILLQTLVLAFFPVVLFLIGKELAGRPLGLGLALLAVFRDLTANVAAPFALNYTYTKLFFSEIPAALLISLFTLLVIRWMREPKPPWYALVAGGLLGLSSLIRLQSAVVLAVVIPISFFIVNNRKKWLMGSIFIVLGVALALLPWLARNYRATGGIVLDNPISQTMVLARRWSGDNGNTLIPKLLGENDAQYSSRMTGLALSSLRTEPGRILGSAVNHFFNNEIANLLVLPLRDHLDNPGELIWPSRAFWQTWKGQPTPGQIPLIAFYLLLFGLGLAAAFHKNRLLGLLPLALSLVYNAWTALFLSSGDRFLVPVDWAVYLYPFLGLLTLGSLVLKGVPSTGVFLSNINPISLQEHTIISWKKVCLIAILILFCGASIPLTEFIFPQKYPTLNAESLSTSNGTNVLVSLQGRAIYPRWYEAGEGEPGTAKLGYGKSDQSRLVFFLVGEKNSLVIFPSRNLPEFFPNVSDVTITGIFEDGVVNAVKIDVFKDGRSAEYLP
jgi:hypothetical protein